MKILTSLMLLVCFMASGCSSEQKPKKEDLISVASYIKNEKARQKKLTYCKTLPKEKVSQNCINAVKAKQKLERKKFSGF
jgi:uncharacterized protein YcfL